MNWFYNKTITFRKDVNTYNEDTGMYAHTENETITVCCDVQPLDTKTDLDETGKLINAQYKVFCDSNTFITLDCIVHYDGAQYQVVKITNWDDYYIVYLLAVV